MRVFGLFRVAEKGPRDIDPGYTGAPLGKQPRVVTLAAANVETRKAIDLGQHLEQGRPVQAVAVMVVAGPHQLRPSFGVPVPVPADILMVHTTMLQRLPAGLFGQNVTRPVPVRQRGPTPAA